VGSRGRVYHRFLMAGRSKKSDLYIESSLSLSPGPFHSRIKTGVKLTPSAATK